MKQFLVVTLALTLIFPAYSFGNPVEALPIGDELMEETYRLMSDEEIVNEVMWIIEDGVVEAGEIENLKGLVTDRMINPSQDDTFCMVSNMVLAISLEITIMLCEAGSPACGTWIVIATILLLGAMVACGTV